MPDSERKIPAADSPQRRSLTALTVLFTVVFFTFVVLVRVLDLTLKVSLVFWLPVVQLFIAVTVLRCCGWPRLFRERAVFVLAHLLMMTTTTVITMGLYRWARTQVLDVLLRLSVCILWLLPALGVLLVIETFRRGELRWRAWVPRAIRICIGSLIVLFGIEGSALLIESRQQSPPMTQLLPEADDDHIDIAAVGGSTMLGFPYAPHWGIGEVAVMQLNRLLPGRSFRLQNLAETGVNLEQAISRIHQLKRRPQILLVYSGHNEFLHRLEEIREARRATWGGVDDVLSLSPTFRLMSVISAQHSMVNMTSSATLSSFVTRTWPLYVEHRRLQRYRDQLQGLFQWAKANKIAVVYCVPAADEATCAPLISLCRSTDDSVLERMEADWLRAQSLQQENRWQESLTVCEQALKSQPEFAHFHFLAGCAQRQLGHPEQAREYFQRALDLDQFPIRAKKAYQDAGRDVAREQNVMIVDCPEILREQVPDGFLDHRQFPDGVHPNLKAYFVLGMAVADAIAGHQAEPHKNEPEAPAALTFEECLRQAGVTRATLVKACRTTANALDRYSFYGTYHDDIRPAAAEHYRALADQLEAGQLVPGESGTEALRH